MQSWVEMRMQWLMLSIQALKRKDLLVMEDEMEQYVTVG